MPRASPQPLSFQVWDALTPLAGFGVQEPAPLVPGLHTWPPPGVASCPSNKQALIQFSALLLHPFVPPPEPLCADVC